MKRPPARALGMRTIMDKVESLLPRHKLIAVDACFSGYAARAKSIAPKATERVPLRLARWIREPVVQILTAGRAGQEATEKDAYGHGVFTWYLLKGLKGNADEAGGGPDGLLSFDELAAYVRNRVSREPGVEQDPQAAQVGEGQFVFVLKEEGWALAEAEKLAASQDPQYGKSGGGEFLLVLPGAAVGAGDLNLGIEYEKGEGVPQDYTEAVKWYYLAAGQGDASAQLNLGYMYEKGLGVPKNYAEAHKWYNLQHVASVICLLGLSAILVGVVFVIAVTVLVHLVKN